MSDLRARAKTFYNALDLDRPINFGQTRLIGAEHAQPEELYVPNLHGEDQRRDPMVELANQIDFSDSAGAYLFTGNRGTGKTSELLRLAKLLTKLGCEVFYVDMAEYLNLSQRVEVTDFLISVLGALSEKVNDTFASGVGQATFFERVFSFLQSEVKFTEVSLPAGPAGLKAAIHQSPHFKEELQRGMRGHVQTLTKKAHDFALEVVKLVRERRATPDLKVVLLVDSVERLKGSGDTKEVFEVFQSSATLFASHAESLRFPGLSVVYTIPPYLQALEGGLGSDYAGGRIYALPSVHVYACCPKPGERPARSEDGIAKMLEVVERRFPGHADFFAEGQLARLASSSGGDLRDFFRMIRLALAHVSGGVPFNDATIAHAEDAVRRDMLPLADDDRERLLRVANEHALRFESLERLPHYARLQQGRYMLQYRNGEDWYAVHPLLWQELGLR